MNGTRVKCCLRRSRGQRRFRNLLCYTFGMGIRRSIGVSGKSVQGNVTVGLVVSAGVGLAVTGALLSQSVNLSLRKIASSEGEQVLVNYAKKQAAITAATTAAPCADTAASATFSPEPSGSPDSGLQSRCFQAGDDKILQACKVCTPGQPGYQVVSVQLPAPEWGACGAAGANWVAYTYTGLQEHYIYLSPWPAVEWSVGDRKLYTLDAQRVFKGGLSAFNADPIGTIQSTPDLPRGQAQNETLVFNVAQLLTESSSTQTSFLDGLAEQSTSTAIARRFLCSKNRANDTNCYSNSGGAWIGAISSGSAQGPFFVTATGSDAAVTFVREYQEIGKYCACAKLTELHPNFDYVESRMAPYLTQPGQLNLDSNEMPIPELNLSQTTDSGSDSSTFPDDDVWVMVRDAKALPADVERVHFKRSQDYLGATHGAIRRVYSFTVKFADGHIEEVLTGTEHNNSGVGRKIYLVGNSYVLQSSGCSSAGVRVPTEAISCRTPGGSQSCQASCSAGMQLVTNPYYISGTLAWSPAISKVTDTTISCGPGCSNRWGGGTGCTPTVCGAVCAAPSPEVEEVRCTTRGGATCQVSCEAGKTLVADPYVISGVWQWGPRVQRVDESSFRCFPTCSNRYGSGTGCQPTTCGGVCSP